MEDSRATLREFFVVHVVVGEVLAPVDALSSGQRGSKDMGSSGCIAISAAILKRP